MRKALAALVALAMLAAWTVAHDDDGAICDTDTDCARLCPEGTRDLPADHPDYCDGGPQS